MSAVAARVLRSLDERSDPDTIVGLDDQHRQLRELVEETVTTGRSHSALLIGPRGSGKTLVIHRVLRDLRRESREFIVVQLSGLVHRTDEIAARELSLQLHSGGFAKTAPVRSNQQRDATLDLQSNSSFIIDALKKFFSSARMAVVVVLDDFDLFITTRQSLLYFLLDLSHTESASVCLLGTTACLDVVDRLEKRVQSRLSRRQILFYGRQASAEADMQFRTETSRATSDDLDLERYLAIARGRLAVGDAAWNQAAERAVESAEGSAALARLFDANRSVRALMRALIRGVILAQREEKYIDGAHIAKGVESVIPAGYELSLEGLSTLQLILLSAMMRREQDEVIEYEMEDILRDYERLANDHPAALLRYPRQVAIRALETLVDAGLVLLVASRRAVRTGTATAAELHASNLRLAVSPDAIEDAVRVSTSCPTAVQHWALRRGP